MNSKMWVAFLAGGVLAGGLVLMISRSHESAPAVTGTAASAETVAEPAKETFAPAPFEPAVRPQPRRTPQAEQAASRPATAPGNEPRREPKPAEIAAARPVEAPVPPRAEPAPVAAEPTAEAKKPFEVLRPSRDPQPAAARRDPRTVTIPLGTVLHVRLLERLSTESNTEGDEFSATLDAPLIIDGFVIAERGARAEGKVVSADKGGKVKGVAQLSLMLTQFRSSDGQIVKVQTDSFVREAEKSAKKDALKVGIGAGIGAAIGAIAGGGRGAAIGAGAGSAAGTGAVLATRGEPAELASETRLSFRLSAPVAVTEKLP